MSGYNLPSRLSFSDIALLDVCKGGLCGDLPFDQLLDIAYKHGLNVKKGYEIEKGLHRNLQGKVIDGEYLIAEERIDKEWIKSGHASMEAIMISSRDKSLVNEMKSIQNQGKSVEQYGKGKV